MTTECTYGERLKSYIDGHNAGEIVAQTGDSADAPEMPEWADVCAWHSGYHDALDGCFDPR